MIGGPDHWLYSYPNEATLSHTLAWTTRDSEVGGAYKTLWRTLAAIVKAGFDADLGSLSFGLFRGVVLKETDDAEHAADETDSVEESHCVEGLEDMKERGGLIMKMRSVLVVWMLVMWQVEVMLNCWIAGLLE